MDPYHTLGIPRESTREEVKDAVRNRAWRAHPDRGGDELTFIRLCAAYKQILDELDGLPRPAAWKPAHARHNGFPSIPPDPDWEPELVVLPEPPDPNWEPELVVDDRAPWSPRFPDPIDPEAGRKTYIAWLRRVSELSIRGEPWWRSRWVHT